MATRSYRPGSMESSSIVLYQLLGIGRMATPFLQVATLATYMAMASIEALALHVAAIAIFVSLVSGSEPLLGTTRFGTYGSHNSSNVRVAANPLDGSVFD